MKEPWVPMEHDHGPDKTYSGFLLCKMWSEIEYANLGTDLDDETYLPSWRRNELYNQTELRSFM